MKYIFACALFAAAPAFARDINWPAELGQDLVLVGATVAIDRSAPPSARFDGGEFPTQSLDDGARRIVHGRTHGRAVSARDRGWREASNVGVGAAGAMPAVAAFFADDEAALGRILTTGHALLLSNLAVETLKKSVRRPRPKRRDERAAAIQGDDGLSFPSGHTAAAFAGATLVNAYFPAAPLAWRAAAYALATATGVARMAGDKHYLTDVATGGLIGTGAALLTYQAYETGASPWSLRPQARGVELTYRF